MAFTSYDNSGLAALGSGIDSLGTAFQNYQKQQSIADLGQNLKSGNFDDALKTAAKLDPTGGMMLKVIDLQRGQAATNAYNSGLGAMYGGGTPSISALGSGTGAPALPTSSPASTPGPQASADPNDFAKSIAPHALQASQQTGVDPRIIVAQAAIESGYGQHAPGNNLFGIKSTDGTGNTLPTTEVVNGQPVTTNSTFAAYKSPADSVLGYANFINANPRYAALRSGGTFDDQIKALGASGYATDPNYAAKVRAVASRIDPSVFQGAGQTAGQGIQLTMGPQSGGTATDAPQAPVAGPRRLGQPPAGAAPAADSSDPRVVVPGYKGTWSRSDADATDAEDSPTAEEVGKAQSGGGGALPPHITQGIAATPPASSTRIQRLIALSSVPGLNSEQQKTLGVLLQSELDKTKLPDAQKNFLFAKTPQGGNFQGSFQDFQDKTSDPPSKKEWDAIVADNQAKGLPAPPAYGQWLQQRPSDRIADPVTMANKRAQVLQQNGIDPASPQGQDYILNGKVPDMAQANQMKATEQKLYSDAQNKTLVLQQSIADLQKAKQLNPQVYSGSVEPGAAAFIHRNTPFGLDSWIVNPDRVTATTNFENLVTGANAALGKELFGARVTNYDEQLLQKLRANPNMAPDERAALLDQMIQHRQETLQEVQNQVGAMKAGTRFQRTPGTPQQGAPSALPAPQPSMPQQPPSGQPIMLPQQQQQQPSPALPQMQPNQNGQPPIRQAGPAPVMPSSPNGDPAQRAGSTGAMQPGAGPIRVNSPADAMRLPAGTRFVTPDNQVRVRN